MKKILSWLLAAIAATAMCVMMFVVPAFAGEGAGITETVNWIKANWDGIKNIILILISLCSAICVLTPTPKDDTFLAKIKDFISMLSIFNSDGSSVGRKKEDTQDEEE